MVWALAAASPVAADPCAAWPGEPQPLPRVDDADEMRSRWASLRAAELASAAEELEARSPLRAHRLWRRVLCLDAGSDRAVAGLARTPPVAVHQPALTTRTTESSGDAWALSDTLRVRLPQRAAPAPPPAPREPEPSAFDRRMASLREQVRGAQFEAALAAAAEARSAAGSAEETAQVDVLAATAALALGRSEDADRHLGAALAADPDLQLDPMTTPPKVRRALDRVRGAGN